MPCQSLLFVLVGDILFHFPLLAIHSPISIVQYIPSNTVEMPLRSHQDASNLRAQRRMKVYSFFKMKEIGLF